MGIHPVTTVILLITLIVAIAIIVSLWMTIESRAGHAIQIQNVSFEDSRTTVYVQNVGKGSVILFSIMVNDIEFDISKSNCEVGSKQTTTIQEGETAKITVLQSFKERVYIKVLCQDGTFYEGDWNP